MNTQSKIYVAGNTGLVGSAIVRMLHTKGYTNIVSSPSSHWDLRRQEDVERFFRINEPEYVYLAAAKVGGIGANNDYPAHFIYDNLMIQSNIIHAARKFGVKKLLFLGSSCIYPKMCDQPIKEEYLMTGSLEPTNDSYAVAKIAGIKMCQAYRKQYGLNAISLMPTNLYGPNDNFDQESSHVLPAMIAKFHATRSHSKYWEVKLWGDGSAMREFLHVDDLAEACFVCMKDYNDSEPINVGTGEDITIKNLAGIISNVVGYTGEINWDTTKPNGTPRKVLDVSKIKSLGWQPKISLEEGIRKTYEWYKDQ
jgi:GDP-L-fucose synthase